MSTKPFIRTSNKSMAGPVLHPNVLRSGIILAATFFFRIDDLRGVLYASFADILFLPQTVSSYVSKLSSLFRIVPNIEMHEFRLLSTGEIIP